MDEFYKETWKIYSTLYFIKNNKKSIVKNALNIIFNTFLLNE